MNKCRRGSYRSTWIQELFLIFSMMLVLISTAYAGPFREIGYDSATQATANSNVSYGDGPGVLYTNPALISRLPDRSMFFIGITFWKPNFNVTLFDKSAASDVPITIYTSKIGTEQDQQDLALPTVELKNKRSNTNVDDPYAYVSFGSVMKLPIKGLRFGSVMMIPIDSLQIVKTNTHFATENEQYFSNQAHFSNFGEWGKMIDGVMGISYAPWDFLSFGVSLKIGMSTVATVDIYMPDATVQDYSLINNRAEISLALKPIVGIQAQPLEWMAFGLTWRHWSYMDITGGGQMGLWQLHETSNNYTVPKLANQTSALALDYEPMELAGSVGFKFRGFTTQATVTWNMWHWYLDNHHEKPEEAAHFPTSPFYADPLIGNDSQFKFKDTVSVAWSGQYEYYSSEALTGEVLTGFGYQPTPVPAQIGRTNYADSDKFMGSVGHKLDFVVFEQHFGVDVGLQYWHMMERKVYKDPSMIVDEFPDDATSIIGDLPIPEAQGLQTNNPGYPGYKIGGYMVLASFNMRYEF